MIIMIIIIMIIMIIMIILETHDSTRMGHPYVTDSSLAFWFQPANPTTAVRTSEAKEMNFNATKRKTNHGARPEILRMRLENMWTITHLCWLVHKPH